MIAQAQEQGMALTGPDGLLKQLTKTVLETALNAEMTEHLGHAKHQGEPDREGSNVRNVVRSMTVMSDAVGEVEVAVPRDREGDGIADHRLGGGGDAGMAAASARRMLRRGVY